MATNKERQIEKRNQEMARRKQEAEAMAQALRAKKRKSVVIVVVVVALVIAIGCGIAIPVAIAQSNKYQKVNFRTLPVPTTAQEAQSAELVRYNQRNVEMEGYTFACTSQYYVLCKNAVKTCPYVAGSVPDNGVRMEMKDGSHFNLGSNAHVRIRGKLYVNTRNVEYFEKGLETYMYLVVDTIEQI